MSEPLPIAVRAYARPLAVDREPRATRKQPQPRRRRTETARRPSAILVIDCETTADAVQSLQFGVYRYHRLDWTREGPELSCVVEGLFYADELPIGDPNGFACLQEYVRSRPPEVAVDVEDVAVELRLLSRGEFCERALRAALSASATLVGFNLPFDLSRLAFRVAEARGEFAGGFSLCLYAYEREGVLCANPYRPRVVVRSLDSKRSRIRLSSTMPGADSETAFRGRAAFLDLHTLSYTLTGSALSLEAACQAFGVTYRKRALEHGRITSEYIDYCREDVSATASLYEALALEYERW
jgi:hypothetical protein